MASAIDTARPDASHPLAAPPLSAPTRRDRGGDDDRHHPGDGGAPLSAPARDDGDGPSPGARADGGGDRVSNRTGNRPGVLGEMRAVLVSPMRSLTRRIVATNLVGLVILVASVLYLNQMRDELIQVRVGSLATEADILATAIAEIASTGPEKDSIDTRAANRVLQQLTLRTDQRAQLFRNGRLIGDTRSFDPARARLETRYLPPLDGASGLLGWIEELYSRATRLVQKRNLPLYIETSVAGITEDPAIYTAQLGETAVSQRANSDGELIVSVAVPVRRLKVIMGVLMISTEGGDIDRVIRAGRIEIMRIFIVAALVSVLLAILLANGIARPLRRLANAAEAARANEAQLSITDRVEIPDLTARADEIGHLSGSMRRMTDALYGRIDAIESFAADVAHEIKNPLSSLRSATETLDYARTPEQRERLYTVIREDVDRLDRLVTDISNASRLDAELVREERAAFDLGSLVETTADILSQSAEERGVRLVADIPQMPLTVRGLESRIAQVVSNILTNGISFSPEGGTLHISAWRDDLKAAVITVEDEGPGIPPDNLDSIFQRFYTERPEGEAFGRHSGLGLSISRSIVEAHGGTIRAENREGGGARFVVRLPS